MGVREREQEWIILIPKFGNEKELKKTHSQNSELEGNGKRAFPKFGNGKGMNKSIPT